MQVALISFIELWDFPHGHCFSGRGASSVVTHTHQYFPFVFSSGMQTVLYISSPPVFIILAAYDTALEKELLQLGPNFILLLNGIKQTFLLTLEEQ